MCGKTILDKLLNKYIASLLKSCYYNSSAKNIFLGNLGVYFSD